MFTGLFYPPPALVADLGDGSTFKSLRDWCAAAGVACRASGPWTERGVAVARSPGLEIRAEPGDWGRVLIHLPEQDPVRQARAVLLVMAYAVHDLVAKQSVSGMPWAKPKKPPGRPKLARPLSGAERQRRHRALRGQKQASQ